MKDADKAAMLERFYKSRAPNEKVQGRKEKFAVLNAYVNARHGFITSVPGDREVTLECLPDSSLPDELRAGGASVTVGGRTTTLPPYALEEAGEGQRILPVAIVAEVLTEGSTVPIRMHHAGIVTVKRYSFTL